MTATVDERSVGPSRLRALWMASRPATLSAAIAPVAVGSAVAYAEGLFRFGPALAAALGALAIQVGTNLANDVYDAEKGADTSARLGPPRAVASGFLSGSEVKRAMVAVFLIATVFGLYLTAVAGPWVVAIGLTSIAAGIAYTAGPYALAYIGLGDVFVLLFFGFVAVCGTAFVESGRFLGLATVAAVPVGCVAIALLVINNVRDRETDRAANKRTLVVRFGRKFGLIEHAVVLSVSYLIPVVLLASGRLGPAVLLPWVTVGRAWSIHRDLWRLDGPALNGLLKKSGALLFTFGVTFAVGIALGRRP